MKDLVKRLLADISEEGMWTGLRKARNLIMILIALPVVIIVRLIKPFILIRFRTLKHSRIGHFLIEAELYLCKRDVGLYVPAKHYVDIFYIHEKASNNQLAIMWRRVLNVWPFWIINPIVQVNRAIPFGRAHEINLKPPGTPRDIHNLLEATDPHLYFTDDENTYGEKCLREMGIPEGALFVCLNVRDGAYLTSFKPKVDWSYHTYRDSDIANYVLVADELAERGYYVIRMGAKVHDALQSLNTKVIDYATNGMRTDFMDIYLGANCTYTITSGSGWDHVPNIFRRPIVYVNIAPAYSIPTWRKNYLTIIKHHWSINENRELTLSEIFAQGAGFLYQTQKYEAKGISLIENTPEEIRDICVEMADRLNGEWQSQKDDEVLQKRFWDIFPKDAKNKNGVPFHGEIRSRFGSDFLRNNPWWLQ